MVIIIIIIIIMMIMIIIIISSLLKLSGDLRLIQGARFTRRLAFYASHFII